MNHFEELASSRRQWIQDVLTPWCRTACLRDLREAERDWINLAGRVDPKATLWSWAWKRFPDLVHDSMAGVNETIEVCVTLRSGELITGFADNTLTEGGKLILLGKNAAGDLTEFGPLSIDDIESVVATDASSVPNDVEFTRPPTVLPPNMDRDERL